MDSAPANLTPNPSPPRPASSPSGRASYPGSMPLPDRAEAERIVAQRTAEVRRGRAALPPDPLAATALSAVPAATVRAAADDRRHAEARNEDREARERARKLWDACGVPALYRDADLNDLSAVPVEVDGEPVRVPYAAAVAALRPVLAAAPVRPPMFALLGPRGPGKTWVGCAAVREFCRAGRSALYADAMDVFLAIKGTYDDGARLSQQQVEDRYLRPALLVLDELHERGDTAWEDRMLTRLINKRYAGRLATILISNQSEEDFAGRVGQSVVDRMADGGGIIVCDWPSLRGRVGDADRRPS